MVDCCASCKYMINRGKDYLYPYRCKKHTGEMLNAEELNDRINRMYKCKDFRFMWEKDGADNG